MEDRLIAIVDDDADIIDLIGHGLRREGFRVKGFSCAEDLFGFLDKEKPDLILLDIMLPGVNGFEICKTLKKKGNRLCSRSTEAETSDMYLLWWKGTYRSSHKRRR